MWVCGPLFDVLPLGLRATTSLNSSIARHNIAIQLPTFMNTICSNAALHCSLMHACTKVHSLAVAQRRLPNQRLELKHSATNIAIPLNEASGCGVFLLYEYDLSECCTALLKQILLQ